MWDQPVCPIFRINFKKVNLQEKQAPGELVNSETLKMVRDMDQHKEEDWGHQGIPAWNQVLQSAGLDIRFFSLNISYFMLIITKL
jgi:hypothetical protein